MSLLMRRSHPILLSALCAILLGRRFTNGQMGLETSMMMAPPPATPNQQLQQPQSDQAKAQTIHLIPLIDGIMYPTDTGYVMVASVTLIIDQGYAIIVDSPSAADAHAANSLINTLARIGITAAQIHYVVTTHGHPDHTGQTNLFSNARHLFGPYEYVGSIFNRNQLFKENEMNLTKNVEIWNTPGHTNQDISVIVRNVPKLGTVGVVGMYSGPTKSMRALGDLFYSALDAQSNGEEWSRDAWNAQLGLENRKRVICYCDAIVPGHSKIFKITDEMKAMAGCGTTKIDSIDIGNFHYDISHSPAVANEAPIQGSIVLPPQFSVPQLTNYLSAADPGAPIPIPKAGNAEVRTFMTIH